MDKPIEYQFPISTFTGETKEQLIKFVNLKIDQARKEGLRENIKKNCKDCKLLVEYGKQIGTSWGVIEEHVVKAEVAWHETLENEVKKARQELIDELKMYMFENSWKDGDYSFCLDKDLFIEYLNSKR